MAKRYKFKKRDKSKVGGDYILAILVLALVVFGILMVFSASYYTALSSEGDAYYYLKRDIIYAVIGTGLLFFMAAFDYRRLGSIATVVMVASFVLLCLLFPFGTEINYAVRWLKVGPITFMPGEFAKLGAILFTSWYLSRDKNRILSFKEGIAPMMALAAVYGGLIMMQPNMSTAITICGVIFGIMFMAGLQWRWIIGIGTVGIVAGSILIFSDEDGYRLKRVTSFLDPFQDAQNTGYQVVQSLMALGSGGLFGKGLGKSIEKYLYLPEPQNDFILAIIGEELGYCGLIVLMIAYMLLIWRGFHIALRAKDQFGCLLASGITFMIAIQVVMNVAVATSSMPPTGVTLPFISYGGNALWLFMGCSGILLNISRHPADEYIPNKEDVR